MADLGTMFGAATSDTFLGLDSCDDLTSLAAAIALIGVPCATPYASVGPYCKNAPRALRDALASLTSNLTHQNFDLGGPIFPDERITAVDCGDLPYDEADSPGNRDTIRHAVETILNRNAIPLLVGGDDSVPIPMLEALSGAGPYTILQIDAHIDWRDSVMGETMGLSSNMRRASEMPHVERIVQVGARGIGSARPADYDDAVAWGVHFHTARDVASHGIAPALERIPEGSDVVVCIDVDGLDPSIVPGVIGRGPGGLSYFQTLDLIQGASQRGRIAAINFVEFMPERDVDGIGALTVANLIASTMGILARQIAR